MKIDFGSLGGGGAYGNIEIDDADVLTLAAENYAPSDLGEPARLVITVEYKNHYHRSIPGKTGEPLDFDPKTLGTGT